MGPVYSTVIRASLLLIEKYGPSPHIYNSLERVVRIELTSSAWKAEVIASIRYPQLLLFIIAYIYYLSISVSTSGLAISRSALTIPPTPISKSSLVLTLMSKSGITCCGLAIDL